MSTPEQQRAWRRTEDGRRQSQILSRTTTLATSYVRNHLPDVWSEIQARAARDIDQREGKAS